MTSRTAMERMPGFRFQPTNEELIEHYLKLKSLGYDDQVSAVIAEIDICKHEPWQLPQFAATESDNDSWYFFTSPDYYQLGSRSSSSSRRRSNRKTAGGYWKVTGKDRKILGKTNNEMATKKTLVFYQGRGSNAVKTNWVIHEYHSSITYSHQRDFVLCCLKKKPDDDDIVDHDEDQSQLGYKANSTGNLGSPSGFNDEHDLGCPSAKELQMYMWKEGPSSYGNFHDTTCDGSDGCIYNLEMIADDHLSSRGADYEEKYFTEFVNSLFV